MDSALAGAGIGSRPGALMTRTVLVTGCSSGIGNSCARVFHREGWNVVATLRQPAAATELGKLDKVLIAALDVTDPAGIAAAIQAGLDRFGDIDMVINNAGFALYGVFESLDDPDIRRMFDTNLFGVMNVIRGILPHFRSRKAGHIVNISSGGGIFSLPAMSLYCASKFALEGFSEGIYHELAAIGISVKLIEPGGVLSTPFDRTALARMAQSTPPPEYEPFLHALSKNMEVMRRHAKATADDVAEAVFVAANDGTNRLRYVVTEDIKELVRLRHETSEEQYMAFVREYIAPELSKSAR
jgi:NAD(P)-dependent dehydrogenase (short-subunit alcohol dehydrogenase family)